MDRRNNQVVSWGTGFVAAFELYDKYPEIETAFQTIITLVLPQMKIQDYLTASPADFFSTISMGIDNVMRYKKETALQQMRRSHGKKKGGKGIHSHKQSIIKPCLRLLADNFYSRSHTRFNHDRPKNAATTETQSDGLGPLLSWPRTSRAPLVFRCALLTHPISKPSGAAR
uniref:Uncharacterized protein n=1 Tax=Oryza meridionalis TaxID=40149 RepID=A0A0E0CC34_9ORYZ